LKYLDEQLQEIEENDPSSNGTPHGPESLDQLEEIGVRYYSFDLSSSSLSLT
jgi:hypothetical protein